jgi:Protein of unknown function (DUF2924)
MWRHNHANDGADRLASAHRTRHSQRSAAQENGVKRHLFSDGEFRGAHLSHRWNWGQRVKMPSPGTTVDAIRTLADLDRPALTERWTTVFGCPAPRNCRATLLRSALAWHYQMSLSAKAGSGGMEGVMRRLRRALVAPKAKPVIALGTRLVREWQGQTHHVTVLARGFEYGGKTFRSLSGIARQITGTAWSGPAFFGVHR